VSARLVRQRQFLPTSLPFPRYTRRLLFSAGPATVCGDLRGEVLSSTTVPMSCSCHCSLCHPLSFHLTSTSLPPSVRQPRQPPRRNSYRRPDPFLTLQLRRSGLFSALSFVDRPRAGLCPFEAYLGLATAVGGCTPTCASPAAGPTPRGVVRLTKLSNRAAAVSRQGKTRRPNPYMVLMAALSARLGASLTRTADP